MFSNAPVIEDEIYDSIFKDHPDPESEAMFVQALELISCAVLLILERQCKDQLPGGKYWQPSPSTDDRFQNVPPTNLVGERDFPQLDLLIRVRQTCCKNGHIGESCYVEQQQDSTVVRRTPS